MPPRLKPGVRPNMEDSGTMSLGFVHSLVALADRLAERHIVLNRLHCDWSVFGNWSIEVTSADAQARLSSAIERRAFDEPGPEVFRVTWDARDGWLSLASTPTGIVSMLNQWRELESRSCDSSEVALSLAYEWLSGRVGSSNPQ